MLKPTKLAQVSKEFRNYKLEVLGICEIRWKGSGERRTSTGEYLLYSGKPEGETHHSGVGFMLTRATKQCLLDWQPVSDRIITARFKTRSRNLTFIQAYAPTLQATDEEKTSFYEELSSTFRRVNKSDIKILMGDFNAKVGDNNYNWEAVMGNHGIGQMNANGELLADLCVNQDLVIGGTLFPHKNIHKVTWVSPDSRTQNQIDHICISKKWRSSLLDVRNCRGADVHSDHHLLSGYIRLKLLSNKQRHQTTNKKLNIAKLRDPISVQNFKQVLSRKIEQQAIDTNVSGKWRNVATAITETGVEVLGYKEWERKEWISDVTWDLILQRKSLKQDLNMACGRDKQVLTQSYHQMDKKVSRSARTDKRKWLDSIADRAQQAANAMNSKETYRLTQKLTNKRIMTERPVRSSSGSLLTTETQQIDRWTEHFRELLNRPCEES